MSRASIFIWSLPLFAALILGLVLGVYWWHFGGYATSLDPEKWGQFGDYMGGVLNPILSLFALVAVLITLRVQMKELASASKMAALHANTAAISTKISYSTLVASNRAHVVFVGERYISHPVDNTEKVFWRAKARWMNRGNTPAMGCQIVVRSSLFEARVSSPEDLDWSTPDQVRVLSISPGVELNSGAGEYAGSDLRKVKDGTHFLYVWGWCIYRDIFEETPIRRTQFALESGNVTGDPEKVWNPNLPFDLNLRHFGSANLVDEDCDLFLQKSPKSSQLKANSSIEQTA